MNKLNVSNLADYEMQNITHMETNMMNLSYNDTINNQWETLCKKVYETCIETMGHTNGKHQDWFDKNDDEILSMLEERLIVPTDKKQKTAQILNCKKATSNIKCLVGQES